ncbi:MAG: hypothetical protein ACR2JY_19640 [Chloroflexota bacterium]
MAADASIANGRKPRGRSRIQSAKPLVRRNLLLNPADLARLRALYEAKSDSDAVRQALDAILMWRDIDEVANRIAASGGPDDVNHRTTGEPPLLAMFDPAKVTEEDRTRG